MPTGPKISILVSGRQIASRERMFFKIAEHLARRGARVEFLAAGPERALREAMTALNALRNLSPLPNRFAGLTVPHGLRLIASIPPLARYLRDERPDVLFTTSVPPNLIGLLAQKRSGGATRIVVRQSNAIGLQRATEFGGVERRWRDRLIPPLYSRADAIIANSNGVARNLVALGLSPERIIAIPNGIDCDWISSQASLASIMPLPTVRRTRTIVTIGRLVPQKDHATLLRGFAVLAGQMDCRLVIVGNGPELFALQTLARKLGVAGKVRFAGYQANPYAFLARADLFVLSSRYEGMPNVLLEALACGLPVASTDCPSGPREILANGAYGELVPVGDAARLAVAMSHALQRRPEPERQRGRARVFDVAAIAERYTDVILGADGTARRAAQ